MRQRPVMGAVEAGMARGREAGARIHVRIGRDGTPMVTVKAEQARMEQAGQAEPEPDAPGWAAERRVVQRFLGGDRSAFAELLAAHQQAVTRLAHRLLGWPGEGGQSEVEDVVQEVFVAAMRHLRGFRWESSLRTWLMTLTVNECRRVRRRRMLRWSLLRRWRESGGAKASAAADEGAMGSERSEQVRRAVRELPVRYREVVVLRYLEGMDAEGTARVLGLSRNAMEVRLHRAKRRLREMLGAWVEEGE